MAPRALLLLALPVALTPALGPTSARAQSCTPGPDAPDRDGDGTADACDACPIDPNKTAWGFCGCGVADGDVNGDDVPDCIDTCDDIANTPLVLSEQDLAFTDTWPIGEGSFEVVLRTAPGSLPTDTIYHYLNETNPTKLAAGDFDGDGVTDLAVLHGLSGPLSVLWSDGAGGFQTNFMSALGGNNGAPIELAVGQIDGHPADDLLVGFGGNIRVYPNPIAYGGYFYSLVVAPSFPSFFGPLGITTHNFDADGGLDVIADGHSNSDDRLELLTDSYGSLVHSVTIGSPGSGVLVRDLAAADLDGDGLPDVVELTQGGRIKTWLNRLLTQSTFVAGADCGGPCDMGIGTVFQTVAVADLDHDARPDVAVAVGSTVISRLGTGDGGFGSSHDFNFPSIVHPAISPSHPCHSSGTCGKTPTASGPILAGDFTGDGKVDLVVAGELSYAAADPSPCVPNVACKSSVILVIDVGPGGRPSAVVQAIHGFGQPPAGLVAGDFDAVDRGPGDDDGDGYGNACDTCPGSPKGSPGVCGCELSDADSDGDDLADCLDECPDDPEKQVRGCGCGVPDGDFDGDGRADCVDNCPAYANPSQVDGDADGFGDACDACIDDARKFRPGRCGCGAPDIDHDGDGILDCDDPDDDGDGICDGADAVAGVCAEGPDVCPITAGAPQIDSDGDGLGDFCGDYDQDNDQVCEPRCPSTRPDAACSGHGVCDPERGCVCDPDHGGVDCSQAGTALRYPCAGGPTCGGRGVCNARTGWCVCDPGYSGHDCQGPPAPAEDCHNGEDDDGDGFVDCLDSACVGQPQCMFCMATPCQGRKVGGACHMGFPFPGTVGVCDGGPGADAGEPCLGDCWCRWSIVGTTPIPSDIMDFEGLTDPASVEPGCPCFDEGDIAAALQSPVPYVCERTTSPQDPSCVPPPWINEFDPPYSGRGSIACIAESDTSRHDLVMVDTVGLCVNATAVFDPDTGVGSQVVVEHILTADQRRACIDVMRPLRDRDADGGIDCPDCGAHGACDPADGRCRCDGGWRGDACDEDVGLEDASQSGACWDGSDNNGDGRMDCDDPTCAGECTCDLVTPCEGRVVGAACEPFPDWGLTGGAVGVCYGGDERATGQPCLDECVCRANVEGYFTRTQEHAVALAPRPTTDVCPCFDRDTVVELLPLGACGYTEGWLDGCDATLPAFGHRQVELDVIDGRLAMRNGSVGCEGAWEDGGVGFNVHQDELMCQMMIEDEDAGRVDVVIARMSEREAADCMRLLDTCTRDLDGNGVRDCLDATTPVPEPEACRAGPDNCPTGANPDQADTDTDGIGVPCDVCPMDALNDIDQDLVCGDVDLCPEDFDPEQLDVSPANGYGDACEPDRDWDGICTTADIGEVPACRVDADCLPLLRLTLPGNYSQDDLAPHVRCDLGPGPREGTCRLRDTIDDLSSDGLGCATADVELRFALSIFNAGRHTTFCASPTRACVPGVADGAGSCTGASPPPECVAGDPELSSKCAALLDAPPDTPFVCIASTCAVDTELFAAYGFACTSVVVTRAFGRRQCVVTADLGDGPSDYCVAREVAGDDCLPPDGGLAGCLTDEDCAQGPWSESLEVCGPTGYCEPTPWGLVTHALSSGGHLGASCGAPELAVWAGGPRCRTRGSGIHAACGYGQADAAGWCLAPYPCTPGPDNCPRVPNADQADRDHDALGDACDECPDDAKNDQDDDGLCADADNCPTVANEDQTNFDEDSAGDVCDHDQDGDSWCNDPRGLPYEPILTCLPCGRNGTCNPRTGRCYCTDWLGGDATCADAGSGAEGAGNACDDGYDNDGDGAADCRDAGCAGRSACAECAIYMDCNVGRKVVGAPCRGEGGLSAIEGVCSAGRDVPIGAPCAGDCACMLSLDTTCGPAGCTFEPDAPDLAAACPCFDESDVMQLALAPGGMACELTPSETAACVAAAPSWMNPAGMLAQLTGGSSEALSLRCRVEGDGSARAFEVRPATNVCTVVEEGATTFRRTGAILTEAQERTCIDLLTRWQIDADRDQIPDVIDPDVVVSCPGEDIVCNGNGTCNPYTGNCLCDLDHVGDDCRPASSDFPTEREVGGCDNGEDDDLDGLTDCADASCRETTSCAICGMSECGPGTVTGERCAIVSESFFDEVLPIAFNQAEFRGRCHAGADVPDGTPCLGQCLCLGGGFAREVIDRGAASSCAGRGEGAPCDVGDGGLPGTCFECDETGCACRRSEALVRPPVGDDQCPCFGPEALGAMLGSGVGLCFGGALGRTPCDDAYVEHVPWMREDASFFGAQTIPPDDPSWVCFGGDLSGMSVQAQILALMGPMNLCMNVGVGGQVVVSGDASAATVDLGYHRMTAGQVTACNDILVDCLDQNVTTPGLWSPRDRNRNRIIDCLEDFTDQPRCRGQDNCPDDVNADQADADRDTRGDVCDICPHDPWDNEDGDERCGDIDNCPTIANDDQANFDGDTAGDVCDHDWEGDGWCNDARGLPFRPALTCLPCGRDGVCNPRTGVCHCTHGGVGGATCAQSSYESDFEGGCQDGQDNDQDGAADCRDPSCAWHWACQECPVYDECNDGRKVGDTCRGTQQLYDATGVCAAGDDVPDGAPCAGECLCRVAIVQDCANDGCVTTFEPPPMDDACPCFTEEDVMAIALPSAFGVMSCEASDRSEESGGCAAAAPSWVDPMNVQFSLNESDRRPTILLCEGDDDGGALRSFEVRADTNVCRSYDAGSEAQRVVFMTERQERSCVDILTRWQIDADHDGTPDVIDDEVEVRCPGEDGACGDGGVCNPSTGRCFCEPGRIGDDCAYPYYARESESYSETGPPCANGYDDDGDGLMDCADASCREAPECAMCGLAECGPNDRVGDACTLAVLRPFESLFFFGMIGSEVLGEGTCSAGPDVADGDTCLGRCRCVGGGDLAALFAMGPETDCRGYEDQGRACDPGDGGAAGTCQSCGPYGCVCVRNDHVFTRGADDACPCFGREHFGELVGGAESACFRGSYFEYQCGDALADHVPSVREDASFFGAATLIEEAPSWICLGARGNQADVRYSVLTLLDDIDTCIGVQLGVHDMSEHGARGELAIGLHRLTPGQVTACTALFTECLDQNATYPGVWSVSDRNDNGVADCVERFSDQPACKPGDNCPDVSNADQADRDRDRLGDVCDDCPLDADNDIDIDTICGDVDNCPRTANTDQANLDGDTRGDVCDSDEDGDAYCTELCPFSCSGHGTCGATGCACEPGWFGPACDSVSLILATCAGADVDEDGDIDECFGRGVCNRLTGKCHCTDPEATGADCRGEDVSPEGLGDDEACTDGIDNDDDGATDCMDAGCAGSSRCYICQGYVGCNDGVTMPGDGCVEVISGAVFEGECFAGVARDPSVPCVGDCTCRWRGEFACGNSACSFDPLPLIDPSAAICPCFDAETLAAWLAVPGGEVHCQDPDLTNIEGCVAAAPSWMNPLGGLVWQDPTHEVSCVINRDGLDELVMLGLGINLCQHARDDGSGQSGTIAILSEPQEAACADLIGRFARDSDGDGVRDLFDPSNDRACPGTPPCSGHGQCDTTTFQCVCEPTWNGPACDVWRNPDCAWDSGMTGVACDEYIGTPESCWDGLDDGGDGAVDCGDPHCLNNECGGCGLEICNDGAHAVGDDCPLFGDEELVGRCHGGKDLADGAPCTGECLCTGSVSYFVAQAEPGNNDCDPAIGELGPCTIADRPGGCYECGALGCYCVIEQVEVVEVAPDACPCFGTEMFDRILAAWHADETQELECEADAQQLDGCGHAFARYAPWVIDPALAIAAAIDMPQAPGLFGILAPSLPWLIPDADIRCGVEGEAVELGFGLGRVWNSCFTEDEFLIDGTQGERGVQALMTDTQETACLDLIARCTVRQSNGQLVIKDFDGDGRADCNQPPPDIEQCVATDCQPRDPAIHPDARELCDGQDNDCNGLVDDMPPLAFHLVPSSLTVMAGGDVTWTVHLENASGLELDGLALELALPQGEGLAWHANVITGSGGTFNAATGRATWPVVTLRPGEHTSVIVVATATGPGVGPWAPSARVTGPWICPLDGPAAPVAVGTPPIAIVAGSDLHASCGDDVTWTFTVSNPTATRSGPVVVTHPVAPTDYIPGSIRGRGADASTPGVLRWMVGPLDAGEGVALAYVIHHAPGTHVLAPAVVTIGGVEVARSAPSVTTGYCPTDIALVKSWNALCAAGDLARVTIDWSLTSGEGVADLRIRDWVGDCARVSNLGGGACSSGLVTWSVSAEASAGRVGFDWSVAHVPDGVGFTNRAFASATGLAPVASNQVGAASVTCDDNDRCTADACSPSEGCVHVLVPDPTIPDDTCDAIDDDCDREIDEDYVGTRTSCGQGVCVNTGVTTCVAGHVVDVCTPLPPAAASDTSCNAKDDDCDGPTDEDFVEVPTSCGLGVCAATGHMECVGGQTRNTCAPAIGNIAPESCDNLDNDCDGAIDALDSNLVRIACPKTAGVCQGALRPTTACVGGTWLPCSDATYAAHSPRYDLIDRCDGFDNDCDASLDEDFAPSPTTCGRGACLREGETRCEAGKVVDGCVPGPTSPEICNAQDDDCDDQTDAADPDLEPPLCARQAGVCQGARATRELCVNGVFQPCPDGVYAMHAPGDYALDDRRCDGLDNDCSGAADEDFVVSVTHCGQGVCSANTGLLTCVSGDPHDSCQPLAGARVETCDDRDDDCDGETDEGFDDKGLACDGDDDDDCEDGRWVCKADGSGLACDDPPGTGVEICDGKDNDCNDRIDEGCDDDDDDVCDAGMICLAGGGLVVPACPLGCGDCDDLDASVSPRAIEVCNGKDDDCRLGIDEGCDDDLDDWCDVQMGCDPAALPPVCPLGCGDCSDLRADVFPGNDERCNLIDDNCDLTVDEGFVKGEACTVGSGACVAHGLTVCASSGLGVVCDAVPIEPLAERCNGLDDDCDGATDESFALGLACARGLGECRREGVIVCDLASGAAGCSAEVVQGVVESCNGKDDDCDGFTDNNPAFPTVSICPSVDTVITSGPPSVVGDDHADFTFVDPVTPGNEVFECSLDGADWAPCPGGRLALVDLEVGRHVLLVRAHGVNDTVDTTPAFWIWEYDPTIPDTSILVGPEDPSQSPIASFAFEATLPVDLWQCAIDWVGVAPAASDWFACDDTWTFTGLADGPHRLAVRVTAENGKTDPTPATWSWLIDTTAPDTRITSGPPPIGAHTDADLAYESPSDASITTFECRIDGGAWSRCDGGATALVDVGEGQHVFEVRAIDGNGVFDPVPARWVWVVDVTPPETTIPVHPDDPSQNPHAVIGFGASERPVTFWCVVDPPPTQPPGPPALDVYAPCDATIAIGPLADGEHVVWVFAVDGAGNADATPASYTWTIDTRAPETAITLGPPALAGSGRPTTFEYQDPVTPDHDHFECRLDAGAWTACDGGTVTYAALGVGTHVFSVRTCDAQKPPDFRCDPTPATWRWEVTVSPCPDDEAPPTVTCAEALGLECVLGTAALDLMSLAPAASDACGAVSITARGPERLVLGDNPIVYVVADRNGNQSTCLTVVSVLDRLAPAITCPADIVVDNDPGLCGASLDAGEANAVDACHGPAVFLVDDAPAAFPVGTTLVTHRASDDGGLESACVQSVTVADAEAMTLTCTPSATADAPPDACAWRGSLTARASDNCGVELELVERSGTYPVGRTPVVFAALDESGAKVDCTTMLTVRDVTPPVATCGRPVGVAPTIVLATAEDACTAEARIDDVSCALRFADGSTTPLVDCPIVVEGAALTIGMRLGEGALEVAYTAAAIDDSGNRAEVDCLVVFDADRDGDGVLDEDDVCIDVADPLQADTDDDGVGDACDVCIAVADVDQADADQDGVGDACDLCPAVSDPKQGDLDGDEVGDACDVCPRLADDQADGDANGIGDACQDLDADGLLDLVDNCPHHFNPSQADFDEDGLGDPCDPFDGDGLQALGSGGCAGAGAGGLGGTLVLVVLLALGRRGRRRA